MCAEACTVWTNVFYVEDQYSSESGYHHCLHYSNISFCTLTGKLPMSYIINNALRSTDIHRTIIYPFYWSAMRAEACTGWTNVFYIEDQYSSGYHHLYYSNISLYIDRLADVLYY
jgi:hypothetical protein